MRHARRNLRILPCKPRLNSTAPPETFIYQKYPSRPYGVSSKMRGRNLDLAVFRIKIGHALSAMRLWEVGGNRGIILGVSILCYRVKFSFFPKWYVSHGLTLTHTLGWPIGFNLIFTHSYAYTAYITGQNSCKPSTQKIWRRYTRIEYSGCLWWYCYT